VPSLVSIVLTTEVEIKPAVAIQNEGSNVALRHGGMRPACGGKGIELRKLWP
jgi:hypothetical protein